MTLLGYHYTEISFGLFAAILYATFNFLMIFIVLRFILCTDCAFYGKYCYTGWGLLASKLFKRETGNFKLGTKISGVIWFEFILIPLISLIYSLNLYKLI